MTASYFVKCSWCGKDQAPRQCEPGDPVAGTVSHSICGPCAETWRVEKRADDAPFRGKKEVTPTQSPAPFSAREIGA